MNTKNNKRKRESQNRIEHVFVNLIQEYDLNKITVSQICQLAHINRSTFYANYEDIYDLAQNIIHKMENDIEELYHDEHVNQYNSFDLLRLVKHIYNNQIFYKTYFKLGADESYMIQKYDIHAAKEMFNNVHIDYHILFFMNGFNAMLKKWLFDGCPFPPDEFMDIIMSEYKRDI